MKISAEDTFLAVEGNRTVSLSELATLHHEHTSITMDTDKSLACSPAK